MSLRDDLTFNFKYSYGHRDYYHMNDNDYSVASEPFVGLAPRIWSWTNFLEWMLWRIW